MLKKTTNLEITNAKKNLKINNPPKRVTLLF